MTISDDGTGSVLTDADNDGVADFADLFPSDSTETIDTDQTALEIRRIRMMMVMVFCHPMRPLDATETKDSTGRCWRQL